MSKQKILFLVGVIVLAGFIALGAYTLSKSNKEKQKVPTVLKVWIREGTTESYDSLKEGFKQFAPEYVKMDIVFEKKTPDPLRYRTLLLSTMSDASGPDVFMLGAGEDDILESKIDPIPRAMIDINAFEKKYDSVFFDLITSTGSKDNPEVFLKGVPLGFETLGIFYNKGLIREMPSTWDGVDGLYSLTSETYPTNLGLGPKYTPNAADILGHFSLDEKISDYVSFGKGSKALERYTNYAGLSISQQTGESDTFAGPKTLETERTNLDEKKYTTYDMFLDGKIGFIVGYPSIISELEKSAKRVGTNTSLPLILTERMIGGKNEKKNLVRYNYFALSKYSNNSSAGAKFLAYLMTEDAEKRFLEKDNTLIAAQRSFWEAQKNTRISDVFARAKLDAFIPEINESLAVFQYGLKSEFESLLSDSLDRNTNIDIGNIPNFISHGVECSIDTYLGKEVSSDCEQK